MFGAEEARKNAARGPAHRHAAVRRELDQVVGRSRRHRSDHRPEPIGRRCRLDIGGDDPTAHAATVQGDADDGPDVDRAVQVGWDEVVEGAIDGRDVGDDAVDAPWCGRVRGAQASDSAALRSCSAWSARSQVNVGSSRPK